ncbi:tetratricopeptide repeat protein [Robertkochia solimangrovi]|uniref:tetratricopeptide repeat protein n=1 Tax=Robertkochia solimangrovi TaxID=2213046 RepID=UPI001F54C3BD|nr:tetratricopeptide repeat protein [Robertkochia solimangrovi]
MMVVSGLAQEDKEKMEAKNLKESLNYTWEGNEEVKSKDFVDAEMNYRKAIDKSGKNASAPYNLGNVYYNNNSYGEAFMRYKEAGTAAEDKPSKHKAFHNMGNVFMKNKEYQKAVDAYKEALRNDPSDEETRYNLALAKEMLKKQQDEQKNNDQDKDDQKQDQDKDKDQNKDQQDKDENQKDQQQDQKDQGEGDKDKQDQNEGDQDKDSDQSDDQKDNGKKDQQKDQQKKPQEEGGSKPRPNQLSPQQIKNILEAMNNEEKKVQEKVNAKKVKGQPVKTEKDW